MSTTNTTQHNYDVGWGKKRDGATNGRTDGGSKGLILGVGLDDMKDASQSVLSEENKNLHILLLIFLLLYSRKLLSRIHHDSWRFWWGGGRGARVARLYVKGHDAGDGVHLQLVFGTTYLEFNPPEDR